MTTPSDNAPESLQAAIAALEAQRAVLGDAVVDVAVASLRRQLTAVAPAAPRLQRRQVSVLFADIVGSTAITQRLDAEEVLQLLGGALQAAADVVVAQGGRVLRFTGDGLKAAFGIDEAHEDQADHAVQAGLGILQVGRDWAQRAASRHGIGDFALRVGVHTGMVVLGAGVEADNTAMGEAVHVAARMEQTAPPGALRVSHDTWALVRGRFEMHEQPPIEVKGLAQPMRTHLVLARAAVTAPAAAPGLDGQPTPLVGRDEELALLRGTIGRAASQGVLQALTLIGEAGLGKSRLLREVVSGLAAGRVWTARAHPDGLLRPWGLLRSLLARRCGITDSDSGDEARARLLSVLPAEWPQDGQRLALLVGQLAGWDFSSTEAVRALDPRTLRQQALAAAQSWLQGHAQREGLLVLVLEDLHWADDASLDWLAELLHGQPPAPLALLTSARPTLLERRPDWGRDHPVQLLQALGASAREALGRVLLQHIGPVPEALQQLIVERAEGNPYYMEELVRHLVDEGVVEAGPQGWQLRPDRLQALRLPSTLVGILQARLDALPESERRSARQASVVGHVFWDDALAAVDHVAPQSLDALQRRAIIRPRATSSFDDTAERQFDHHLLHEVTYHTVLLADRRAGHAAVAGWLAGRTRGRDAEFLAITGDHAERGGDLATAVDCFEQAAREAGRRFANQAAQAYLRRAIGLLGQSQPLRRFELLNRLDDIADMVGDRAAQQALQDELAELLRQHPDDAREAQLLFARALLADRHSDHAAAEPLARRALELAERSGAAKSAADAAGMLCWLDYVHGRLGAASRHIERALDWAARAGDQAPESEAKLLLLKAMIAIDEMRHGDARRVLEAALARGEELGTSRVVIGALDNLAALAMRQGRWSELDAWAVRMQARAQAIGALPRVAHALQHRARAARATGDLLHSERCAREGLEIVRANGDRRIEAVLLLHLGDVHLDRADHAAALAYYRQSEALYQALDDPVHIDLAQAYAALSSHEGAGGDGAATTPVQADAPAEALAEALAVLARVDARAPPATDLDALSTRWACQRVLARAGDAGAASLLERLRSDAQVLAQSRAAADDGDVARMQGAIDTLRDIAAAATRPGQR